MLETLEKEQYVIGTKQVKKALVSGKVSKLYIASDSDKEIIEPIVLLAQEKGTEVAYIPTRTELGKMCKIAVKAACVAVTI